MGFHYGYEAKKFEAKWKVLRKEYEEAGMGDEDILSMRDWDWDVEMKSERRFRTHNQPLGGFVFSDGDDTGEDQSPLLGKFSDRLSVGLPEIGEWGRHDWVEDIDTPELARRLKTLPAKDLELLTRMVKDNARRADLSRELGVSRAAVTKRLGRIKKVLRDDG